ncbi:hypothetical protein FRB94_000508 [Tulasnella sp. JGI-2019a]|nr:hypothetical protein FRB94_000508 [Tulasnella sp. JGI-2019a]KAG9039050.1 hypothetical protein FRB95_012761 [Tulasnella sp. JGI-2019a]
MPHRTPTHPGRAVDDKALSNNHTATTLAKRIEDSSDSILDMKSQNISLSSRASDSNPANAGLRHAFTEANTRPQESQTIAGSTLHEDSLDKGRLDSSDASSCESCDGHFTNAQSLREHSNEMCSASPTARSSSSKSLANGPGLHSIPTMGFAGTAITDEMPSDSLLIPATLATFTNAHLLLSAPFSCPYDEDSTEGGGGNLIDGGAGTRARQQPGQLFKACALPLRPVRPHGKPRAIKPQNHASSSDPTAADPSSDSYLLKGGFVDDDYEERDTYEEAPDFPYHPANWRKLPGPGLASPRGEQ